MYYAKSPFFENPVSFVYSRWAWPEHLFLQQAQLSRKCFAGKGISTKISLIERFFSKNWMAGFYEIPKCHFFFATTLTFLMPQNQKFACGAKLQKKIRISMSKLYDLRATKFAR